MPGLEDADVDPGRHPAITAIVVHYHASEWCHDAVVNLRRSEGVALDLIVVDNSGDLGDLPSDVTVIRTDRNRGYAGGANVGLRAWLATDQRFCFVASHDVQVAGDTLRQLVDVAESKPSFGCLAPWFSPRVARVGELGNDDDVTEFEWVSGSGFLWRRECLEDIGLFDEDFGSYTEDREICLRARTHGWRIGAVRSAGASSRGSAANDRAHVMMHGNQMLLLVKQQHLLRAARVGSARLGDAGRELVRAASPHHSTRGALRRARLNAQATGFGTRQVTRFLVRRRLGLPTGAPAASAHDDRR